MKRAEPDDLWPKPQYYSIYCPVCGRPAARLVYQAPVARYKVMHQPEAVVAHAVGMVQMGSYHAPEGGRGTR